MNRNITKESDMMIVVAAVLLVGVDSHLVGLLAGDLTALCIGEFKA